VVVLVLLLFSFPVDGRGGGVCPLVLCSLLLLSVFGSVASCLVNLWDGYLLHRVAMNRLLSLCSCHFLWGWMASHNSVWHNYIIFYYYRGADKSLARPGRKQARKHVRDARDFNNIETRAVIKFLFFPLQGKVPKEIHAILTETLACFLPGRAKHLSAPLLVLFLATRFIRTIFKKKLKYSGAYVQKRQFLWSHIYNH